MTLAHRLLSAGRANGIFLALPTMATANAMFGRLADSIASCLRRSRGPRSRAGAQPRRSRSAIFARGAPAGVRRRRPSAPGTRPMSRRRPIAPHGWRRDSCCALLAQVGVGTLDQALLAALPVRHAPLRLQGLSCKVLIVDEAHAFDPYMRRELVALLRFHAALGGSVVLLSATLPLAVRQGLVDAFRDGLEAAPQTLAREEDPLATLAAADGIEETPCDVDARPGLARRVVVTRLADADAALERHCCCRIGGRGRRLGAQHCG